MKRIALLILQCLLALSALVCGALLILAPDGRLIQLPLDALRYGPFEDFFWPGVILFLMLGAGHAIGFVSTLRRSPRYRRIAMLLGLITLGWIGGQVLMVRPLSFLQSVVGGLGALELLLAFSLRSARASSP